MQLFTVTPQLVRNYHDNQVVGFALADKLKSLRNAISATRSVNTHRANRDYKRFNDMYCEIVSTYFRLYPNQRVLP